MSKFTDTTFPHLLDLIYAAGLEPSAWQTFLDALTEPFGGANGVLYAYDKQSGLTDFSFNYGTDPAFHASYADHYYKLNPYGSAVIGLEVGRVLPARYTGRMSEIIRSEFYNDWMKPQGIPADHFGVMLRNDEREHVVIGIAPHTSLFVRHHDRYARELATLVPHITRALAMNDMVEKVQATSQLLDSVLESYGAAAFLIVRGRPELINTKAAQLLATRVFRINRYGNLVAGRPEDESRLASALEQAHRASPPLPVGPVKCVSRDYGTAYYVWLMPLSPSTRGNVLPELQSGGSSRVLMLVSTMGQMTIAPETIREALQLTRAEAQLASAIAGGSTMVQYATKSGLSRHTVRNQLSSIFAKTGTSRQAELVALIATLARTTSSGRV